MKNLTTYILEKFQITKNSVCTNKIADLKNLINASNTGKFAKIMLFKDVNVYKYDDGEIINNSELTENINKYFDDNEEVYVVTKHYNFSKKCWDESIGNADISNEIRSIGSIYHKQFLRDHNTSKIFHVKELRNSGLLVLMCKYLNVTKSITKIEYIFKYL